MSNGSARESAAMSTTTSAAREQLSALVDGELEASQVAAACAAWKEDPQMRATWHSYQLIGDVLRSDDLAVPSQRDHAFIGALRLRLAAEPVVLAPQPAAATSGAGRRSWGWTKSSAVAAGFMAVAGVVFVTRAPTPSAPAIAAAPEVPVVAAAASLSLARFARAPSTAWRRTRRPAPARAKAP